MPSSLDFFSSMVTQLYNVDSGCGRWRFSALDTRRNESEAAMSRDQMTRSENELTIRRIFSDFSDFSETSNAAIQTLINFSH